MKGKNLNKGKDAVSAIKIKITPLQAFILNVLTEHKYTNKQTNKIRKHPPPANTTELPCKKNKIEYFQQQLGTNLSLLRNFCFSN